MGAMFGQSSAPPGRDLNSEFSQISGASGQIFDQERDMAKKMGQDQRGLAKQWGQDALELYPHLFAAERTATTYQRGGDLRDLGHFGQRYVDALDKFNPGWQKSLAALNDAAENSGGPSPLLGDLNRMAQSGIQTAGGLHPSALRTELERQAQGELAAGRSLTPEEQRDVQQTARAAYADRGILDSNPALIGEVLARDQYGRQREAERRAFAGQTQQLGQSEDESLIRQGLQLGQFGQGVEGLNEAQQAQRVNTLSSVAQTNQAAFAPVLGFYGRTSVSPTAGAQVMSSAPNIINAGTQAMSPIMNYGQDLFNTNFNSQAATRISNANNAAAIHGAIIGAVGSIAGAGMCWVAREVYDAEECAALGTLKWMIIREWMIERAPRWLFHLYSRRGIAFARWLKTHPGVKRIVRALMDRVLAAEVQRIATGKVRRKVLFLAC